MTAPLCVHLHPCCSTPLQVGISTNFNKFCGCENLWDPWNTTQTPEYEQLKNRFNTTAIADLYKKVRALLAAGAALVLAVGTRRRHRGPELQDGQLTCRQEERMAGRVHTPEGHSTVLVHVQLVPAEPLPTRLSHPLLLPQADFIGVSAYPVLTNPTTFKTDELEWPFWHFARESAYLGVDLKSLLM